MSSDGERGSAAAGGGRAQSGAGLDGAAGLSASGSAPGKVILLGEHAAVYGHPALAAPIERRVRVSVRALPGASLRLVMDGPHAPPELLDGAAAMARALGLSPALEIRVQSELPLASGLGSSAALGVALARALSQLTGKPCGPAEAARLAQQLETRFHGSPSGVDAAACAGSGLILFRRGPPESIREVQLAQPLHLVVALTGLARGTKGAVLSLRERRDARPSLYDPLLASLGELALGGADAAERGDLADLALRFDAAHGILAALGVSCIELDDLVVRMRRAGALGAKLTGAGGGGAVLGIAASAEQARALCSELARANVQAFPVALAAHERAGEGERVRQGAAAPTAHEHATAAASADADRAQPRLARPGAPARPMAARWAVAQAHANIALVKYWGKRDEALLLPEAPSLSLALEELRTTTRVELEAPRDELWLDGKPAKAGELARARALLDAAGIHGPAFIESRNEFPTGAGLASSASGFAALAVAASAAQGKARTLRELSALARLGSGSAARSVPGGWAVWRDEWAEQVQPPDHFAVRMVVAVCAAGPKEVGSRDGMRSTQQSSPFHPAFLEQCRRDLPRALEALAARDLPALGPIAESNALRMHADALAAWPALLYWQPATIACLQRIWALRAAGTQAWATIDAGPHVVALCALADAEVVREALGRVPGVVRVLVCAPAGAARVLETNAGLVPELEP